jgi:rSAM/selenodomain-associated transferase 2
VKSASFSFVIPVLNEQERIAPLLRHLRALYPDCESIVVDGGSNDATVAQALPLCSILLTCPPGRAGQMNAGAKAASTDYVFYLHADTLPTLDLGSLQAALAQQPDWGFCRVRLSGAGAAFRVIEAAMNLRSRLSSVATGDQMIFVQRNFLEQTEGYAPLPLMEDIEYTKRLRKICAPMILSHPVETSSRRWEEAGIVTTVIRMWVLRLAYFLGVQPQHLLKYYYGR